MQYLSFRNNKIIQYFGTYNNFLKVLFVLFISSFFLHVFSPLRLNTDAIRYLLHMELLENPDPKSILNLDTLPNGYTYFILVLKKLGILNSSSIIFSNIVLYILGLYPLILILKDKNKKYIFLLLCFCSWVVQKHLIYPLSEALYIFIANWSLYLFILFQRKGELLKLILAILLVVTAFKVRTIGITLIPLLPLAILLNTDVLSKIRMLKPWIIISTIIGLIGTFAVVVKINFKSIYRYFNDAKTQVETGIIKTAVNNLEIHLHELGEISFNVPKSQLTKLIRNEQLSEVFFILAGICTLLLLMWLIFEKIKRKSIIHIYALIYLLFVFAWPYYDPRFWVPIIPIFIFIFINNYKENSSKTIFIFLFIWISIGYVSNSMFLKQSLSRDAFLNSLQQPTKEDYNKYFSGIETLNKPPIRVYDNIDYTGIDFQYETVRLLKTY